MISISLMSPRKAQTAVMIAVLIGIAPPAHAEIISLESMLQGTQITQPQCAAIQNAVWAQTGGYGFCMRYYLSHAGGSQGAPIVFLQGDKLGKLNRRQGSFDTPPEKRRDVDTANLMRMADAFSREARVPAIYLARVGVDGSSGHHSLRHTVLELQATNAALDQIRQRHNFPGFHLVGQSGGATLVGGILAMRNDIGCAVPGAGRLALLRQQRITNDPSRDIFDASSAAGIIARSSARIMLVTDAQDRAVPERHQTAFVQAVRGHGGQVEQYFVQASDEKHHGMVAFARKTVALCIDRAASDRIASELQIVGQRLAALKQNGRNAAPGPAAAVPSISGMQPNYNGNPAAGGYMPAPRAYTPPPSFLPTTRWPRLSARQ